MIPSKYADTKKSKRSVEISILDRSLAQSKQDEVSLGAFAFLFSEIVQYCQNVSSGIPELENRLAEIGYRAGIRMGELIFWREKNGKREIKYLHALMFIHTTVWKQLFGRQASSLERSAENEDEYMIVDDELLVNRFISVPKDMSQLNCGAFVAGIVEAILEGCCFPCKASVHNTPTDEFPQRTTILIKFDPSVIEKSKNLL